MSKFTEAKLEQAIIALLGAQGYPHFKGEALIKAAHRELYGTVSKQRGA
jgi:type I restriction enzyme R subunit